MADEKSIDDAVRPASPKVSYLVKGIQIVVRLKGGQNLNLHQGAPVPDGADEDHVKHLLSVGLIGPPADKN